MYIRRVGTGGLAALGAFALLTVPGTLTAQQSKTDTSFMGVRLLASFREVMNKFGQPMEIQVGEPYIPGTGAPAASGTGGAPGGGGFRSGGPGGGGGNPFGGAMGGPPGFPGGGGAPGSGGPPRGMGGFSGPGGGGLPGFASGAGKRGDDGDGAPTARSGGGGLPGFPGGGGAPGSGGPSMAGNSGPGGASFAGTGASGSQQNQPTGETTWWYFDKKKGIYRAFLFNKEGKVIQIQLYGYKGGERTAKGIGLGSSLGQIMQKYQWTNDGYRTGENMLLRYGGTNKLAFQLSRNQVVGITLAYVK